MANEPIQFTPHSGDLRQPIKIDQGDLDELLDLIQKENQTARGLGMLVAEFQERQADMVSKVVDAHKAREEFCLRLKKKYKIPDVQWDVKFDTGEIDFEQKGWSPGTM